jgi:hypothetical protein
MRTRFPLCGLVAATVLLFLAPLALPGALGGARAPAPQGATASPTPACGLGWRVIPNPAPVQPNLSDFYRVAALAPDDIWVTGSYSQGSANYPLVEHWDGTAWQIVPVPGVGTNSALVGIAALAPDNIWAAGTSYNPQDGRRTLIEHWDGQQWQIVPSPNPNSRTVGLRDLAAAGPADIWAVGTYSPPTLGQQTFTMHWAGQSWQIVPSPNAPGGNNLYNVAALAPDDVWAVGSWDDQGRNTLTLHWDGQAWAIVPSPNPEPGGSDLYGVTALAATDAWAVGFSRLGNITMHWDGATWQDKPSPPPPGTYGAYLNAATARAPDDVWAAGYAVEGGYGPAAALRWDGSAWQLVMPPDPPVGQQYIFWDAAVLPDGSVWAVGVHFYSALAHRALSMHYSPPCTPATPSPSPPTATATSTPLAATATATPCAITFTDVDPNNPFYVFIRCLACRQIVSGYADGTFRWGNDVTRGQLSKIIAGAADLQNAIPSTQQTFADVPNSNTFWLFIERLSDINAISGYTCGGPGEPCDPQNRPYFRWGSQATRGQISKITAVTAGWNGPIPTTQQTFTDVPPTNPFWLWIEELATRNIISGYGCGGPGEPCDPQNRAYFRWGANATRGQMSKIAAESFFPGCVTPARQR